MAVMASRMLGRADLDALPDDGLRHEFNDPIARLPIPASGRSPSWSRFTGGTSRPPSHAPMRCCC